jgi:hypothetical protein
MKGAVVKNKRGQLHIFAPIIQRYATLAPVLRLGFNIAPNR